MRVSVEFIPWYLLGGGGCVCVVVLSSACYGESR